MKWFAISSLVTALALFGVVVADELSDPPAPDGLRPGGTISEIQPAPEIAGETTLQGRMERNWPEQPPVIPHNIRDYQVDARFNRCLTCHSRGEAVEAGAPMVSVSHFRGRNDQVLLAVSPDRYFCVQCHVPQTDAEPLVGNSFRTAEQVLTEMLKRQEEGQ
ncbi:nitrate reductase cytochrome c-type subunit [Halomonas daqiaonensis]|uniref:Periplasmic nitrate reductase, electron transfer subunit n=1 Tax=Halomonas daqiaonensis TaxID=650850 RepID=A0A1H7RDG6_9GAMM|nr:nitrate reductase cytochrome c-type subunit [Halomonas daqiaonensis]SEL58350.1 periplasmic nitrate reductase subunit NapB [Halomonas daqiaonensis]